MKIGLLSTLGTNIGDDFIRHGIINVLNSLLPDGAAYVVINKHDPASIYNVSSPVNWTRWLPRGKIRSAEFMSRLFSRISTTHFDECDMIVQCGAPVYWNGCHSAEWGRLIWRDIIGRICSEKPVLNIAAGSCYSWPERSGVICSEEDAQYIRDIHGYCRVTTVRDRLAEKILSDMGLESSLVPCSALLAGAGRWREDDADCIYVNYMSLGGHYDYRDDIDPEVWKNTLKSALSELSKDHNVAFICHSRAEYILAEKAFPEYERYLPESADEYFLLASRGVAGIFNRLHASVAFAGLGVPSVAVGSDTRMLMVEQVGNPVVNIKDVDADELVQKVNAMIDQGKDHENRLHMLRERTFSQYRDIFKTYLSSR